MSVGIIIQARMGSERLPGKVLKPLPNGEPVLRWVVERCRLAAKADTVIVATTLSKKDDEIAAFCKSANYPCFRGDESDVLGRYLACAEQFSLDTVIRATADCPFIAPEIIDQCIGLLQAGNFDYVNNSRIEKTFPRGLDVEVFSMEALRRVRPVAKLDYQKEHVTIAFYENPELFRIGTVKAGPDLFGPNFRLTVDTPEDFSLICEIVKRLMPTTCSVKTAAIIKWLRDQPALLQINQHIQQKPIAGRLVR